MNNESNAVELPLYKCHKKVRAAKITGIEPQNPGSLTTGLLLSDIQGRVEVTNDWLIKHQPTVGCYYVVYADGYTSCSPAAAFEEGYKPLAPQGQQSCLTFGEAIEALKAGLRVCRAGWNGKGMWLVQQTPDTFSKMTLPYIYIEYPQAHPAYPTGSRVPWLASQTDMLSEDWMISPF